MTPMKMFEVSVAHADEPQLLDRTWMVLARDEREALGLVPAEQPVMEIECKPGRVLVTGEPRIIGWLGNRYLGAVAYSATAHPAAGPHPTD